MATMLLSSAGNADLSLAIVAPADHSAVRPQRQEVVAAPAMAMTLLPLDGNGDCADCSNPN